MQATAQAVEEVATGTEQKKLWGGRFTGATDPLMEKFNESLPFDKRMWKEDLLVGFWKLISPMCRSLADAVHGRNSMLESMSLRCMFGSVCLFRTFDISSDAHQSTGIAYALVWPLRHSGPYLIAK